jgi:hypothetical protein
MPITGQQEQLAGGGEQDRREAQGILMEPATRKSVTMSTKQ